jgi:hypothetical protein
VRLLLHVLGLVTVGEVLVSGDLDLKGVLHAVGGAYGKIETGRRLAELTGRDITVIMPLRNVDGSDFIEIGPQGRRLFRSSRPRAVRSGSWWRIRSWSSRCS